MTGVQTCALPISFPAKFLLNKNLLVGDVLDFGCGFGKDVELLKAKGINIVGYDKHYFPVRVRITEKPEDYIYSSARDYAGLKSPVQVEVLNPSLGVE